MKFVTIREFRNKTAAFRKTLRESGEIVLTANGSPIAIVTATEPDTVERQLRAVRRARARMALDRLRVAARAGGHDDLSMDEIDSLIARARRKKPPRRKKRT